MKEIPLTQGKFAIVDDEDYEELSKHKWYAVNNPKRKTNVFYAHRRPIGADGKKTTIAMHRAILRTPKNMFTDHIDGNGLNNKKSNLRVCTRSENQRNRGAEKTNTSGFKGVTFHRRDKKWQAQINVDGKYKFIGYFPTSLEAHYAYAEACKKYHRKFANAG